MAADENEFCTNSQISLGQTKNVDNKNRRLLNFLVNSLTACIIFLSQQNFQIHDE